MEKWMRDVLPVMAIENDCILSKQGDITIGFKVELPEIFTLGNQEYEVLHQAWVKAIKLLPKYTIFHKQDWYTRKVFHPDQAKQENFLQDAADRHFNGRSFMSSTSYIFLTKKPGGRKPSSSLFSNLIRSNFVPDQTVKPDLLQRFLDSCGQFKKILEDSGFFQLKRLKNNDLSSSTRNQGVIERYCYLTPEGQQPLIKDISFNDGIQIGGQHCQLYTLGDVEDLPGLCGPSITYDPYSTDKTKYSVAFTSPLGQLLPYDHIYNQYIFIEDSLATIKKLETKRLRLQSLSAYSRENTIARDATNDFLNEAISCQRLPVKAHFNVLVYTENKAELADIRNHCGSAFAMIDAVGKQETLGSPQIYWAGIPGNEADFPINDSFDTFLEQATCFLGCEGNAKSATVETGIRFADRLSNRPLFLDLYTAPRLAGLTSNFGTLVVGASGTGKSMLVNHMLRSMYDQGAHCITVDIGGSYRGLCELLNGYYFTYEENDPIRFNPFYLPDGQILDTEKKESLKALLVALWKQDHENFNRSEYVALSNALQGYYDLLKKDKTVFPCFNTFFDYLTGPYTVILKSHRVKDKDFDLDNFLYVLRPYYGDGEFGFLLNATENLDLLNQRFVVFELDNLRGNTILFPVVTLIVIELALSKMRKLKGIRKVLTIDEAWSAIAKSGMAEFIKYAFKTMRKFEGVPNVISQEIDDLISSPVIKDAIINNADIKIMLDMKKFMNKFGKLQDALGLSEKAKTILLSVNKDDREVFIDMGGQVQKVLRNELCPEEVYAYTTDGRERVKVREYAERHGSMENGIRALVKEKNNKS